MNRPKRKMGNGYWSIAYGRVVSAKLIQRSMNGSRILRPARPCENGSVMRLRVGRRSTTVISRRSANRQSHWNGCERWRERDGSRLRSEEHTSELKSLMRLSYAVFCLKKTTTQAKSDNMRTQK